MSLRDVEHLFLLSPDMPVKANVSVLYLIQFGGSKMGYKDQSSMTGNPYGPGRNIPGTADWNAAQTWNKPKSPPPPPSPSPFSAPAPLTRSPSWSSPTTYPSHEVRGSSSIGQGSSERKGSAGIKLLSFLFAIGILFVSAVAKIPLGTMFILLIVLGIAGCLIWVMRKVLLAAAFIGFVLFCIYLLGPRQVIDRHWRKEGFLLLQVIFHHRPLAQPPALWYKLSIQVCSL